MFRLATLIKALCLSAALWQAAPQARGAQAEARARGTLHVVAAGVSDSANRKNVVLGAEANVNALAALFTAQKGKLYEHVAVEKLLGRQASAANILAALDRLNERVRDGDRVVVYLNGHGGVIAGQWHLAATDAARTPVGLRGAVPAAALRSRLQKLPAPVLLVLDSCHSGAFGDGASNREARGQAGLIVFSACLADQYGVNSLKKKRSLFSLALVEALEGKADADGDGVVSLAEADAYVANRLPKLDKEVGPTLSQRLQLLVVHGLIVPVQTPTMSRPSAVASGMPLMAVGHRPLLVAAKRPG